MIVQVEALGFGEKGTFRPVKIDETKCGDIDEILDAVFYWGQNDFQPSNEHYSVSVGDVIWLNGGYWMIKRIGFKKLDEAEYIGYSNLPQQERYAIAMTR